MRNGTWRGFSLLGAAILSAALALLVRPEPGTALTGVSTTAPAVSVLPAISGTAARGKTLSATTGTWTGTSPITFIFRWLKCDTNGSSCSDINGATSNTFVITPDLVGQRLRVRVTASNDDGTAAALSNATAIVTDGTAPANTVEPVVTGQTVQGQTLSATTGTWTGSNPITFAYRWVRCGSSGGNPDGSNCASIGGATSSTYTLGSSDVGERLRVRVTATNSTGTKTVASNATARITANPNSGKPINTSEPAISGTQAAGATLTSSTGGWTGAQPITYSYRWVRCPSDGGRSDGTNCDPIPNATQQTYVPDGSDVGRRLRVQVTARNNQGSALAASNATGPIGAAAPSGTITLPNGQKSIPVTSVPADQRLIVAGVVFEPNRIRSRTAPIVVRIRVEDTRGYVVRDARVFIRSTPLVTTGADGISTGTDGWISVTLVPRKGFPAIRRGHYVQFFVKTYRSGDPVLGGVAGTRLVQVGLG